MNRFFFTALFCFILQAIAAQEDSVGIKTGIQKFQKALIDEYRDKSILQPADKKNFKGIHFFEVNLQYAVIARFVRTPNEKIFKMPTSGIKRPEYVKYGEVYFNLLGREYKLNVYQSQELLAQQQYKDYLFIPFRDSTSGRETYGGGRYIDVNIPSGDSLMIDFNKAYHPYCAYTEGYNCPIPPKENFINIPVKAGVKF